MDQNKVGQYIASCRKEKQMTQGDLAKALNVSVQAVSKWERGNNYPDISLFPKLAEVLGTSVGELLKGEKSTMEIKTEETVSKLIDYTKSADRKKARRRSIVRLIITSTIFTSLFAWSTLTADLKQNPYTLIEVNPETSQLYDSIDQSFPFFFEVYNTCASDVTKTTLFESKIRTFFGSQKEATSLIVNYGTTDTSKVDETDATLWCPLTLEFVPEATLTKDEYPVVKKDYYKNELMVEFSRITEGSNFVDVGYGIYDMSSATDTTQMIMITQFSMVMDDYLIKGELPAYMVKSPQLSNYTKKVVPQDYLDMVRANTQQLAKALLKARSLSNQLDINSTNFYQGYKEVVSNYPFAERRESVFEDNQWRIKQTMVSKDTVVTFTTDLNGAPISIDIDRGDQSTSIGGIAGTLQTVAMNKLTYWPFPDGYLKPIFYNLTENKGPWIIDMKEAKMTVICTDYLRHYQIKWSQ
jgi:transcriptional regulator with XRE-family HTH domain